jgi:hypothetical protein
MRNKKKPEEIKTEERQSENDQNAQMNHQRLIEISRDNLTRILAFFPRVDTLTSVVLAIDIGMLAILASNTPSLQIINRLQLFTAIIFIAIIAVSLYHLYKCAFPRLECEEKSLIYFREIAELEQLEFAKEFLGQSEKDYLHDLIKQTWRNSEILKLKFDHIKKAFIFLVIALVPWVVFLIIVALENKQSFLTK